MNMARGKIYSVLGWVLFVAILLGVKYRREQAYWKDVTDKIAAQMEPPRGQGNGQRGDEAAEIQTADELSGDATVLDLLPPSGMGAAAQAAAANPSDQLKIERLARKLGVLP